MAEPNRPQYSSESLSSPLKTFAIAGGIALAAGGARAIRLGEFGPNILPARLQDHINRKVNAYYAIADRGLADTMQKLMDGHGMAVFTRDSFNYRGGLIHDASEALKITQGIPALKSRVFDALNTRYAPTGRTGEITVGQLLDSMNPRPLGTPNAPYQSNLGISIEAGQFEALERLTKGKMISRDMMISEDLFFSSAKGRILENVNSNTFQNMLQSFKIPFVGNPFDFILQLKQPVFGRASAENVSKLTGKKLPGAFIDGNLYTPGVGGYEDLGKFRALRKGSSEERAFSMSDPKARIIKPTDELFASGLYDMPTLDRFASGLVENRFVENLFGKKVAWSNKIKDGEQYAPIWGEIEERLVNSQNPIIQMFGLDKFGRRFSRAQETFGDDVSNFINRTGKTELYRMAEDAPVTPSKWDVVHNAFGGIAKGKRGYISLTDEEAASYFDPRKNLVDMKALRESRARTLGFESNVHGTLTPSLEDRGRNIKKGRDPNTNISPHYVFAPDNLKTSATVTSNQLINTTVDLLEAMTGMGVKPGGAVGTTAAMVMGSVAAYIAYEGFHFFDYLLESTFGLGIEKTALYGYSAARTAQQTAMLPLQAAGLPLEGLAPGLIDSPLGHGIRGFAGLYFGNKLGRKYGLGGMVGAAAAIGFGLPDIYKDPRELWDEYVGNKSVAIRKSRFWFMGPDDWRGGDIIGYRKSLIASRLDDSQYDLWGGKGSYFAHGSILTQPLRMAGGLINNLPGGENLTAHSGILDPYFMERSTYFSNPYPVTGDMFGDFPVIGPVLGQTVGQIFKPTRLMHTDQLERYYSGDGRATDLEKVAMSLGQEVILPAERMARMRTFGDAFGETIDNTMDIFGMRGFLIGAGKNALTGTSSFAGNPKTLRDSSELSSVSSDLYDANLGGMFGASEMIRRMITDNNSLDQFNPLDGGFSGYARVFNAYGMNRIRPGGIDSMGVMLGSGITSDPMISWDTASGQGSFRIPYVSTKLFGNKNPLEEYKHKVSIGSDFYDWNSPIESIAYPYFRELREGNPIVSTGMNALAIQAFSRNERGAALMHMGSAILEVSRLFSPGENKGEGQRRDLEQFTDTVKFQKIQALKELAQEKGNSEALSKLGRMERQTMTGLDYSLQGDAFAKNAYRVLPRADRRFLLDFVNSPEDQRSSILEAVPGYMRDMLTHMWEQRSYSSSQSIQMATRRHSAAMSRYNAIVDKNWEGWSNTHSSERIKLTSAVNAAGSLHSYGFWGADERDMMSDVETQETSYAYAPDAGSDAEELAVLSRNFGSSVELQTTLSSFDTNTMDGDITMDRNDQIRNHQYSRKGRF